MRSLTFKADLCILTFLFFFPEAPKGFGRFDLIGDGDVFMYSVLSEDE
jgi:hypothetical protein